MTSRNLGLSFPHSALVFIHKLFKIVISAWTLEWFGCRPEKSARRQQGSMDVGKENEQEGTLFRQSGCRKHQFRLSLEPAYSGLHRDVYKDERFGWECSVNRSVVWDAGASRL